LTTPMATSPGTIAAARSRTSPRSNVKPLANCALHSAEVSGGLLANSYSAAWDGYDRGERGPPIQGKRRTVNGILCVLRTGAPWRDMPKRYGNWNSVFVRFTRWSKLGVLDAAFETLESLGPPADEEHAIDSTVVRAHQVPGTSV
jgi:transposase